LVELWLCSPLRVSSIMLSLDHIARRDSTQHNCFVELNRVGRCDHFKDSTRQNSFVKSRRAMWSLLILSPTVSGRIFVMSVRVVEFWTFHNLFRPVGDSRAMRSLSRLAVLSRDLLSGSDNLYTQVQHRLIVYAYIVCCY